MTQVRFGIFSQEPPVVLSLLELRDGIIARYFTIPVMPTESVEESISAFVKTYPVWTGIIAVCLYFMLPPIIVLIQFVCVCWAVGCLM